MFNKDNLEILNKTYNEALDELKIEINKILFESKHFDGTFIEGKKLQEIEEKLKLNGYKLQQIDKENILASK